MTTVENGGAPATKVHSEYEVIQDSHRRMLKESNANIGKTLNSLKSQRYYLSKLEAFDNGLYDGPETATDESGGDGPEEEAGTCVCLKS